MKPKVVSRSPEVPEPPRPLGEAGMRLWADVQREYRVEDSGGCAYLTIAAEALDRASALRTQINAEGMTIVLPSGQVREHPLLKAEVAAMSLAARTLARLNLDVEPVHRIGRPTKPTGLSWRTNNAD